ncbi:MAG: molecular chaperone [Propioniciclava sp.]
MRSHPSVRAEETASLRDALSLAAIAFDRPTGELAGGLADRSYTDDLAACLHELRLPDLADRPTQVLTGYAGRDPEELRQELAVEHFRLFVGTRHPVVSPYESIHRQRASGQPLTVMITGAAADVEQIYAEHGVAMARNEPPDHIAAMLWFVIRLLDADSDAADATVATFGERHLSGWLGDFCDEVSAKATISFYQLAAELLPPLARVVRSR